MSITNCEMFKGEIENYINMKKKADSILNVTLV